MEVSKYIFAYFLNCSFFTILLYYLFILKGKVIKMTKEQLLMLDSLVYFKKFSDGVRQKISRKLLLTL